MEKSLLFFYGLIISGILLSGVGFYVSSVVKESKKTKINHSNFGSD